jgi:hypothetical protein
MATPLQTFQQITMGGIEEVMESKPYGIEVSPTFVAIPFLLELEFIYVPHICMSYFPISLFNFLASKFPRHVVLSLFCRSLFERPNASYLLVLVSLQ